jgi:hypothetical protein
MFKKKKSKMKLSKQSLALLIITPIAILAIILVIIDIYNRQTEEDVKRPGEIISEIDIDRDEIEAIVPDQDTELSEEQREIIAVPERTASSNPFSGTMSQNRSFSFNLENNNLINKGDSGKEINVYQYDNLSLTFTAIDKDYDIHIPEYYNNPITIEAGSTIRRRFQAVNLGSFSYYCEVCGGIDSQASGLINVFERE